MKVTPDDYGRRCQFDHFCKLVLYHEAVDYFRERKRQRGWETSFETLPLSELDTLCTIDQYPSDSFIFPAYGCELQISDGLVAAAFASLPQPGQSILILHLAALYESLLELSSRVEGGLSNRTGYDVLHLDTNKSSALARLYMLELNNLIYGSINLNCQTVSEISC